MSFDDVFDLTADTSLQLYKHSKGGDEPVFDHGLSRKSPRGVLLMRDELEPKKGRHCFFIRENKKSTRYS